jgi:hypothetical protein
MGVDAWTRTPEEQRWRERAKTHEQKGKQRDSRSTADKLKDAWNGEGKKCACGCGSRQATAFRAGKMYDRKCVGRGSGWDKSGLPQDRTPPMSWRKKRDISKRTKA